EVKRQLAALRSSRDARKAFALVAASRREAATVYLSLEMGSRGSVSACGSRTYLDCRRDLFTTVARRCACARSSRESRAIVAGGSLDRRAFFRPTHSQTMVRRQTRFLTDCKRSKPAGIQPLRRQTRLHRQPSGRSARVSTPATLDQRVRLACDTITDDKRKSFGATG